MQITSSMPTSVAPPLSQSQPNINAPVILDMGGTNSEKQTKAEAYGNVWSMMFQRFAGGVKSGLYGEKTDLKVNNGNPDHQPIYTAAFQDIKELAISLKDIPVNNQANQTATGISDWMPLTGFSAILKAGVYPNGSFNSLVSNYQHGFSDAMNEKFSSGADPFKKPRTNNEDSYYRKGHDKGISRRELLG